MKKTVFAGNTTSQYDSSMVLKEAHDFFGQSLRVIDSRSESGFYSHFRANYDGNNNPTLVQYFHGTVAYKTSVTCTAASTLAGKYFIVHSAPDNQRYAIYFTVDSIGTAPVVANTKTIQVSLAGTDTAEIVAAIIKLTLDSSYSDLFAPVVRNGAKLEILTNGLGEVDPSLDVNTGFTITGTQGSQDKVAEIEISYQGNDPVYEGQLLRGYSFDLYSAKFVKNPELTGNVGLTDGDGNSLDINPDGSINVVVSDLAGSVLDVHYSEVSGLVSGITQLLGTYTASADDKLQKIDFSGTNIAEYEIRVNGITKGKKRTHFGSSLNGEFAFQNGLPLTAGQEVEIYVIHQRPTAGDFNCSISILET